MIRRTFRMAVRLGLLAGLGYAVLKVLQQREQDTAPVGAPTWPPVTPPTTRPAPEPERAPRPEPSAAPAAPPQVTPPPQTNGQAWVSPSSDGICPTTHPIKAKQSSKIFHLPGMFAYDRTSPDRCYAAEDAAEQDGFRKAKR